MYCACAYTALANLVNVHVQLKRTNVGISLVSNPRVLFLDEPTSGKTSAFLVMIACQFASAACYYPVAPGPALAFALAAPPACSLSVSSAKPWPSACYINLSQNSLLLG